MPNNVPERGEWAAISSGTGVAPVVRSGVGSPAGLIAASVGSVYLRTDGGASTTLYIKESGGNGPTGWVAK